VIGINLLKTKEKEDKNSLVNKYLYKVRYVLHNMLYFVFVPEGTTG